MSREEYLLKLKQIYRNIPKEKQDKAEGFLTKLADLLVMLDECREHLDSEGCVTEMSQGKYFIMRENPYSKVYDAKYKLMLSTMDKLNKLSDDDGVQRDALEEFLEGDTM